MLTAQNDICTCASVAAIIDSYTLRQNLRVRALLHENNVTTFLSSKWFIIEDGLDVFESEVRVGVT